MAQLAYPFIVTGILPVKLRQTFAETDGWIEQTQSQLYIPLYCPSHLRNGRSEAGSDHVLLQLIQELLPSASERSNFSLNQPENRSSKS